MQAIAPTERFWLAMCGGRPDRVPVAPKISIALAARLTGHSLGEVLADPELTNRSIVDAAVDAGADMARQFLLPARRTIGRDGRLVEVDAGGRSLGEVDVPGGLATDRPAEAFVLEDPAHVAFRGYWAHQEPFVSSLSDVRRMAVPTQEFFESTGHGAMLSRTIDHTAGRLELAGDLDSATLAFVEAFRTLPEALIDLIENPALVHALMEKGEACAIERGRFWIDRGLRVLRLNDSIGNMTVISPRHWRDFVFPHMRNVCAELHRYRPEVRIYCHVCGNVLPILEGLVETGLDCIAPLDPLGGFSVARAREIVGDDVILMGGVNTVSFVQQSVAEIRAEAMRCIEEGAVDGARFILGTGCGVPRSASPESLRALGEASVAWRASGGA
jgi:hypothetical protein